MDGTNDAAPAQRRKRVTEAAVGLAARGGLKALRIRDVVSRTGVSSATIYRYFAAKKHLLVAALAEQRFALRQPDGAPLDGATPAERVLNLLRPPTDALTNAPQLAAAMLQAMTSGEPGVAPVLATITEPLVTETAHAIRPTGPTPADLNSPAPSKESGSPPSSAGSPLAKSRLHQPRRRNRRPPTPRPCPESKRGFAIR